MKLYIPTCTLNFNNIFSTESISPAAFYSQRRFGNKRFYRVEANDLDNVIMLYSKYPIFRVESNDIENSPLVLEIDTEDYLNDQFKKINEVGEVGVYVSASTIYLNPFHVKAYFKSYIDLQSTLSKADQSLENKFSILYRSTFQIREEKNNNTILTWFSNRDSFEWESMYYGSAKDIPLSYLEDDEIIDRLKGCAYCYLIGANMSVSKEVSRLKQLARKMKNVLSAIINSPNKKPTDIQDNILLDYIREFNKIYSEVDDNAKYNRKLIDDKLNNGPDNLTRDIIIKVIKYLGLEDALRNKLQLRPVYDANDLYSCLDFPTESPSDAYSAEIKRLNDAVLRIEKQEVSKSQKQSIEELMSIEGKNIIIKDPLIDNNIYLNTLLNALIRKEHKQFMDENGTGELLSIAFIGGGKLKSCMAEIWEGSEQQKYINGLLSNLQQGSSFDLFFTNDQILQSFAAFCQKGEDVDRLYDYLQQCGINEYRFALAFLGATYGFASLPKTFTTSLIDYDRSYYINFYKTIYGWLFNRDLNNAIIKENTLPPINSLDKPIPSIIINSIDTIEPKPQKQDAIITAVSQASFLEDAVQSPKAFMYILDSLIKSSSNAYKKLKSADFENSENKYNAITFRKTIYSIIGCVTQEVKIKIDKAIELESHRQDPEAFLYILDNFLDKKRNKSAYTKIKNLLNTTLEGNEDKVHLNKEPELDFNNGYKETPTEKETAGSKFPTLRSLYINVSDKIKDRLEQNWNYTGSRYPDNKFEHIKFFINLCKKEGRGESNQPSPLAYFFTEDIAKQVEKELLMKYGLGETSNKN